MSNKTAKIEIAMVAAADGKEAGCRVGGRTIVEDGQRDGPWE